MAAFCITLIFLVDLLLCAHGKVLIIKSFNIKRLMCCTRSHFYPHCLKHLDAKAIRVSARAYASLDNAPLLFLGPESGIGAGHVGCS